MQLRVIATDVTTFAKVEVILRQIYACAPLIDGALAVSTNFIMIIYILFDTSLRHSYVCSTVSLVNKSSPGRHGFVHDNPASYVTVSKRERRTHVFHRLQNLASFAVERGFS